MPAPDITAHDRQHAYRQLAEQLQRLGKSAAQAGDMAKKVEMAAYNKAANQAHYHQLWQTSLRKAQTAIQQQQAQQQAQQAQQQAQLAQQQAQQQAQLAQHQAQQRAQLAAQQQAQQQAQLAAQQQAQQQAQYAAQQQQQQQQQAQYAQQQAQRAAMMQRQQQAQQAQQQAQQAQQQAQYQQQQQQYVAQPVAVGAPQQQYMSAAPQRQQAVQQMQYMQAPQQQAQQAQQPMQYVRQPGAQQYAQPMQPGGQPQYVQVPQAGGQPQYVQQQQYAQQPAAGHAIQQQYMQQQRAVQQAPQAQHAAPASLQAQVAQGQVQQQQQYVQAAPMAVPQHVGGRVPPQGGVAPGMQQQQQPGIDDFMAGFPAPEAGGMLPHGMTYDAQQAQQVAMPATSTTASSVPVAVVGESGAGNIAASVAAGARRPINHEPGPLQEFLRLHSAFNEPRARAVNIRDSEGMLRWHGDLIKRDPSQANKITMHIKRNSAVLALLKSQRPTEEMSIKESVKQAVKTFLVDLKNFRDQLKRSAVKAAAAQQAAAAAAPNGGGAGAVGSPASTGGFLAMMDSGKLDGSAGTAQLPASGSLAQAGGSLPQPGGSLPQPGGGVAAKPTQGRPPAAPGSAASVAAEAARQQTLLRHRQAAAAAGAEQQRRAAAAVPAGPPLPADPTQRLLALAQQPSNQGETAAVRSGFQRLQRALQMEEQRQLAAQVADVPTPPLPPEAQRLVARERAAMEAAAGAGACSPGARAVVSAPSGQGHVAGQEPGAAAGEAEGQPPAKRARSASPDPLAVAEAAGSSGPQAQQAQRPRSDFERRIAGECEEAAAALGGALAMRAAPDSLEAGCVTVACMPAAAQQQGHNSGIKPSWQLLMLRVPPGYPEQPPTAVFRHAGSGGAGASTGQSSTAAQQLQLSDAAAEAFVARLAVLPPPHRLLPLAQAWLEATREVSARLAARQAALE